MLKHFVLLRYNTNTFLINRIDQFLIVEFRSVDIYPVQSFFLTLDTSTLHESGQIEMDSCIEKH